MFEIIFARPKAKYLGDCRPFTYPPPRPMCPPVVALGWSDRLGPIVSLCVYFFYINWTESNRKWQYMGCDSALNSPLYATTYMSSFKKLGIIAENTPTKRLLPYFGDFYSIFSPQGMNSLMYHYQFRITVQVV